MHFCFIAMNLVQDILEENSIWQILKKEDHYVCPIKDLVGTGCVSHLFVVHGLYNHNDFIQIVMRS